MAVALAAGWFIWQPLRSVDADTSAINSLVAGRGSQALADARTAVAATRSRPTRSRTSRPYTPASGTWARHGPSWLKATSVQPENPATWIALAQFDLTARAAECRGAVELRAALRLDPSSAWQLRAMLAEAPPAPDQRRARASSSRLRSGGPATARTSTSAKPNSSSTRRSDAFV